jgi:hypothetical protein
MEWNIYGKLSKVVKKNANIITTITYTYDATGNRVHKGVNVGETMRGGAIFIKKSAQTVYFRDAQGNVLQTHNHTTITDLYSPSNNQTTQTKEYVIYGSSRLGTYSPEHNVYTTQFDGIGKYALTLGMKHYELSNHLGNVLTTISDNYTSAPPSGVGGLTARVLSTQDYYPFGIAMTERSFVESVEKKYRFGFNTQERDEDINSEHYTAEFWEYDGRTGRRWNVDPVVKPWESGYACLGNSPISLNDVNGDDAISIEDANKGKGKVGDHVVHTDGSKSWYHGKEKGWIHNEPLEWQKGIEGVGHGVREGIINTIVGSVQGALFLAQTIYDDEKRDILKKAVSNGIASLKKMDTYIKAYHGAIVYAKDIPNMTGYEIGQDLVGLVDLVVGAKGAGSALRKGVTTIRKTTAKEVKQKVAKNSRRCIKGPECFTANTSINIFNRYRRMVEVNLRPKTQQIATKNKELPLTWAWVVGFLGLLSCIWLGWLVRKYQQNKKA